MPSPVAHTLTGYVIYRLASCDCDRIGWKRLFLYCACSNLPDLDFVPGFLSGVPNQFHHGISHSLGFSIGFGLLMSLALFFMKNQSLLRNFVIFFSLYFSHLLLDLLSYDSSQPYGLPILWPITDNYHISPISVFLDIQRDSVSETFIRSLFSFHNFLAVLVESIIFLPLVALLLLFKRRKAGLVDGT
jgi:inner membrane protein